MTSIKMAPVDVVITDLTEEHAKTCLLAAAEAGAAARLGVQRVPGGLVDVQLRWEFSDAQPIGPSLTAMNDFLRRVEI